MLDKSFIDNYLESQDKIAESANTLLKKYFEVKKEIFGNIVKFNSDKSAELMACENGQNGEYLSFDTIDGDTINYSGSEHWNYGGYEHHSFSLPTYYLYTDWESERRPHWEASKKHQEEQRIITELKTKQFKEAREKKLYEELKVRFEKIDVT